MIVATPCLAADSPHLPDAIPKTELGAINYPSKNGPNPKKGASQQRDAQIPPITIQIMPPTPTDAERQAHDEVENQHLDIERKSLDAEDRTAKATDNLVISTNGLISATDKIGQYTLGLVVFTGLSAIFLLGQVLMFYVQLGIMKKDFFSTHAPDVLARGFFLSPDRDVANGYRIMFIIYNKGGTIGTITEITSTVRITTDNAIHISHPELYDPVTPIDIKPGTPLWGRMSMIISDEIPMEVVSKAEFTFSITYLDKNNTSRQWPCERSFDFRTGAVIRIESHGHNHSD
ncbi:MAG: hypothetical protein WCC64_09285 [Aliidongia sp.]